MKLLHINIGLILGLSFTQFAYGASEAGMTDDKVWNFMLGDGPLVLGCTDEQVKAICADINAAEITEVLPDLMRSTKPAARAMAYPVLCKIAQLENATHPYHWKAIQHLWNSYVEGVSVARPALYAIVGDKGHEHYEVARAMLELSSEPADSMKYAELMSVKSGVSDMVSMPVGDPPVEPAASVVTGATSACEGLGVNPDEITALFDALFSDARDWS